MALRKLVEVEGEAFLHSPIGQVSIGNQKTAFSAYCKIINLSANKLNGQVSVSVEGEKFSTVSHYPVIFSVEENSPNFIRQAYLHLKTLPDFANSIDC